MSAFWLTRWGYYRAQGAGHRLRPAAGNICMSPNGTLLAGTTNDSNVVIWSMPSGRIVRRLVPTLHDTDIFYGIAFSPDGNLLVVWATHSVNVWDARSWEKIFASRFSDGPVCGAGINTTGGLLVTGHTGFARVWDLSSSQPVREPLACTASHHRVTAVEFLDHERIVLAGGSGVEMWDLARGRTHRLRVPDPRYSCLGETYVARYPQANEFVAVTQSCGGEVYVYSTSGRLMRAVPEDAFLYQKRVEVEGIAWSPCGRFIGCALYCSDTTTNDWVTVLDARTLKRLKEFRMFDQGHRGYFNRARSVAFSNDGKSLAVGSADPYVTFFSLPVDSAGATDRNRTSEVTVER